MYKKEKKYVSLQKIKIPRAQTGPFHIGCGPLLSLRAQMMVYTVDELAHALTLYTSFFAFFSLPY